MGQHSPMPPYISPYTPPRASRLRDCVNAEDLCLQTANAAQYLSDLRQSRPARPSGARPPPASKFPSMRRAETDIVDSTASIHNTRPALPSSSSMPIMPAPKLAHRRTDSNLAKKSMCSASSPFAGRPLARPPSMSLEDTTAETEDQPAVRRTPSMPYMENGMRWMEKQEAKSLRQALEDMDLDEERKIHSAAQDEAAELVWRHRNPEQDTASIFTNPDLPKDYRSHLRRGSYQRSHSSDTATREQRTASDGSQHSNPDASASNGSKRVSFEQPRKVSPPTGAVSISKRRDPSRKSYSDLADEVAKDITAAHRRSSSGSKRILSGEKKMFMHPNDRIWEDPQEEESPPRNQHASMDGPNDSQPPVRPVPSHIRKNPFARVRAQYDRMERSNSAPTISTLPAAPPVRHDRVEIQRNAPSQSRNPWYLSNEPLPPTPPESTGRDADEVAPKTTPTKDGREIRGDDIRAATRKARKDYSPNLPRPTMVSDKPGRPIVSFQRGWKPREIVMEESSSSSRPESSRSGGSSTSQSSIAVSDVPRISVDEASKPPIPMISLPEEPSVPTIVLPEDPSTTLRNSGSQSKASATTSADAPAINVSGPDDQSSPTRSPPRRPLPSTRPMARHANTAPVSVGKSTPHYTPSIHQSGALCAHCALPIAGRILSAAGERFHPGCFVCHACSTNLECVAFYPEPEKQREERMERIRDGQASAEEPDDQALRFYCHLDFHELFSPRCKSCKTPIEGEVIVACGAEWHAGHFFCAQCGDPFDSTTPFVEKDGYAWCVGCHTNRYSSKCRKCKKPMTDVVVKALGADWHGSCFVCTVSCPSLVVCAAH